MADVSLREIVRDFAAGLTAADARRPVATSQRGSRTYQAGIGPHSENAAVALVLSEMRLRRPGVYDIAAPIPYPGSRLKCDLGMGDPTHWAIEVKMARAFGDNGKLDDTYVKDLLSPYASDYSALMDIEKLRASGFDCRKAIVVYGYDYPGRPLDPVLAALEKLAGLSIGERHESELGGLVHPVHRTGRVAAWEVT